MKKKRTLASALAEIDQRLDAQSLLSPEDREAIRAKAREHVAKKRKSKAEEEALAAAIEEEERSYNPAEDYEDVTIDLAPYAAFISLDGVQYFHGLTYEVTHNAALTMYDVMARTWEHDNEIHGQRRKGDLVRRPLNKRLSPGHENVPASALNTRDSMRPV